MELRHVEIIALATLAILVTVVFVLGGCAAPSALESWSDEALVAEFERLHRPVLDVYALSPGRPEELWNLLDGSFSGEALTREYVAQLVTVAGMQRDGTRVHVASVDYEKVDVLERRRDAVLVEADWSVGGLVTHRAHTHPRINRYRASYTLALADTAPGELRLVSAEIRSLERQRRLSGQSLDARSAQGSLGIGDLLQSGLADELLAGREAAAAAGESDEEEPPGVR
ncbi:MAG: hypothetical protein AAGA81_19995 [Acidobacteriota bacterium]